MRPQTLLFERREDGTPGERILTIEEAIAETPWAGRTFRAKHAAGQGPPCIRLDGTGKLGFPAGPFYTWLDQEMGKEMGKSNMPPTPEQRADAQRVVVGFVDALVAGDNAGADAILPVTAANAVPIEACGLLIRALRASGRGAELWAQLREPATDEKHPGT